MKSKVTMLMILFVETVFLITVAPQIARAQICAGSHLNYVLRDDKGAVIDASRNDVKYEGEGSKENYRPWKAGPMRVSTGGAGLPATVAKFKSNVVLTDQGMCIFQDDVKLRVTIGGRTMSLLFRMPKLGDYESKDFVVDSLPFRAGDYEITLSAEADTWLNYYAASAWKRVGKKP